MVSPVWPRTCKDGEIVVAGKLVIDEIHLLTSSFARGGQTPAQRSVVAGGAPANMAAQLALIGTPVRFAGWVGADAQSNAIVGELEARGVIVDAVRRGRTPTATVLVEPDGERSLLTDPGVGGLNISDVRDSWFTTASVVHLDGYNLMPERFPDALIEIARLAHQSNIPVTVDVAAANRIARYDSEQGVGSYMMLLEQIAPDVLVLNESEAQALNLGEHLNKFPLACVHRGARSTIIYSDGSSFEVEVDPLAGGDIVDTTGCGDAFAAGLLASWRAGFTVYAAVQHGHRLARRCAGHVGAAPGSSR